VYLVPFAIAVPIGLLLIFFGTRRNRDDDANEDIPIAPRQPAATPVDVPLGETTQFKVDTTAGHGVSVSPGGGIDLPLGDSVRSGPGTPVTPVAAPMTILVVDDSAVPRAKLRKLFEGHGYIVQTADDGVHAMEAINKTKFNVIVTDLEMPNMDGFELIAAIQGSLETEDIPVIAITGHEEMQARVHNIQGLYGIFKKPWNDRELLKRVDVLSTIRK
jgi:CheY-like chemotaxis protein